jgi:peptide-methionine (S)-S-oxide reductase
MSEREGSDRARLERATLGGGCFWCLQPVFEDLEGVEEVVVGYAGGALPEPAYEDVCTGRTGHAEVVQVTFDPSLISFRDLLAVFLSVHDPTTPGRQGADVGTQYRSLILYHSRAQKEAAEAVIREIDQAGLWDAPIVTEVVALEAFYPAEEYHQHYFDRNSSQPYCRAVIAPKLAAFRQRHPARRKGRHGG